MVGLMKEGNWFISVWLSVLSLFVALAAILSGAYIQRLSVIENARASAELKRMELAFKPKQEGYAAFIKAVSEAYRSKTYDEGDAALERVDVAFASLEPFLNKSAREKVSSKINRLRTIATMGEGKEEMVIILQYHNLRDEFHEILVPALFDNP
jgi:hypothetical protein